MKGEVGKETPKKEMDNPPFLDVFLWRHTWHFQALLSARLEKIRVNHIYSRIKV